MRRRRSISPSALTILLLALDHDAWGQACCAGSAAITPARVGPHDDALVGVQVQAASVFGSYTATGNYRRSPSNTSEVDLEQDLFAAVRVFGKAQISLLVPFVETYRSVPGVNAFGGGLGDVNIGARYDLIRAQEFKYVPGIAVLGGLTLPTGRSPDAANRPLATDATGVGSAQGVFGLALEHLAGPWLFNITGLLSKRAAHSAFGVRATLGTQYVGMAAVGYSFDNGLATAILASYTVETNATINGAEVPDSSRRTVSLRALVLAPLLDILYLQGGVFTNPPFDGWGKNGPASYGISFALVRTWS